MTRDLPLAWRLRALMAALVVPPLLYVVPLTRLAGRLGGGVGPRRERRSSRQLDDRALAAWVDSLLRRLPGPWRRTCLKRAAVLYYLLRRAGRPVGLHIGVQLGAGGALAAHAWLVCDAVPYLEAEPEAAQAHTIIARFPEPASLPS